MGLSSVLQDTLNGRQDVHGYESVLPVRDHKISGHFEKLALPQWLSELLRGPSELLRGLSELLRSV